jgi:hypothetical protein
MYELTGFRRICKIVECSVPFMALVKTPFSYKEASSRPSGEPSSDHLAGRSLIICFDASIRTFLLAMVDDRKNCDSQNTE